VAQHPKIDSRILISGVAPVFLIGKALTAHDVPAHLKRRKNGFSNSGVSTLSVQSTGIVSTGSIDIDGTYASALRLGM
jgi:hypothetical protein